eukprot:c461_g1_i1.p1 GENE.c461_g1_i1~~c461_g1_i1.p1  ORF type:complete len:305 (+),score=101.62 c461_g1_i1:64-978(+)
MLMITFFFLFSVSLCNKLETITELQISTELSKTHHQHHHLEIHQHHLRSPLAMQERLGDLRRQLMAGRVRPNAPLAPAKPFIDIFIKIIQSIITLVWSIIEPFITPLLTILFVFVGPLVMDAVGFPLIATLAPVILNLIQQVPLLNALMYMLVIPLFYFIIGIPQTPAYGLPYMSFHGPPYGNGYGQVSNENMKCYSILEEYIKRCTSPPNTLPTSFLEIISIEENDQKDVSFLQQDQLEDIRHTPYQGVAGFRPPVWPGYSGADFYDPYGPDGPESDPAPNVGFQRCHELLDSWLNTCGTPTS